MTKKLFYDDPYMNECEAIVVSMMGPEIVLDQTIFFAFSGGQASDSGTINGIKVIDVVKSGNNIVHVLEKIPDFKEGDKVVMKLDWEKRHKIMKLHSAAHIVYHLFAKKTGIDKLIGSNVDDTKARLDYEYPEPISELLPDIEEQFNEMEDAEIRSYESDEPGRRVWEMGVIKDACGGTHVKSKKEIGKIKLKRKNIGSGKERIEIMLIEND